MITEACVRHLTDALDDRLRSGCPVQFWLRDDDAIEPSALLERLLALSGSHAIPLTLAAIPACSGEALAKRLACASHVTIAVHGWSHTNHAMPGEKKQELGIHRPVEQILSELSQGFNRLADLHGQQFVPLLVPPWNRIAPLIVEALFNLGYRGLSTFGAASPGPIAIINTHVDLIDWKGSRGGRAHDTLVAELIEQITRNTAPIGLLTHHLVHDSVAWQFLEQLFAITCDHAGCQWVSVKDYLPE